jgi:hypothetical protein
MNNSTGTLETGCDLASDENDQLLMRIDEHVGEIPELRMNCIRVVEEDGHAHLVGDCRSYHHKQLAGVAAMKAADGQIEIRNKLEVNYPDEPHF